VGYDDIVTVDRENDLGGTWHVNHHPGLTVGVSSTTYSYWFEPNPYWSRLFAPGAELKRYAEHVADNYNVRRYTRFNTTVEGARWGIFGWIRHMSTSKKVA
jgi:cation diffusion facilitator CzcD-associated flavoprotein CzcO